MGLAEPDEKDRMIASIGPFSGCERNVAGSRASGSCWWLPARTALCSTYLPTALMLIGLIVRESRSTFG